MAGGSLLPWITVAGLVSRTGLDGGEDGGITLALGMVLIVLAVIEMGGSGLGLTSHLVGGVVGVAGVAIGVMDGLARASALVSIGAGIYLILAGSGLAVVVSLLAPSRQ